MQVAVTYTLSEAELRSGIAAGRPASALLSVCSGVLTASSALILAKGASGADVILGASGVAIGLLLVLNLAFGPAAVVRKSAYRLCVPQEAVFTETTYAMRSTMGFCEFRWETLVKSRETSEFFLLYTTVRVATIIPKRAFSAESAAQLRGILAVAPMEKSRRSGPRSATV